MQSFQYKQLISLLVFPLLLLVACSGDSDTPEDHIRKMLIAGEEAVEARELLGVGDFIAQNYKDSEGRGKKEVQKLLAGYLLRNKSIHLLSRIQGISLNEDQTGAEVVLYVGMANVPLQSMDQLLFARADLYRFDLSLVLEEGEWRVAGGSWHPARLEDFKF